MSQPSGKSKKNEAPLVAILSIVPNAIISIDGRQIITLFNEAAEKLFGYKCDEVIGKPLGLLIPERHRTSHWEYVRRFWTTGEKAEPAGGRRNLPWLRKDGSEFPARVSISKFEADGERTCTAILEDIADAKQKPEALAAAKDRAERANLAKSRFMAAASHDLRQPLQTMRFLHSLLADTVSDPAALKLVERLDKAVMSMTGVLDKILDMNLLDAGAVQPSLCGFAINDLLKKLQDEYEIHAASPGVSLRIVPCRLTVYSDPRLLAQILRNLLTNATKYTQQGKILLGCRRRKGLLSIEVWDTGPGIPEPQLSAVFEEYHQLEDAAEMRSPGLGLGLAIVRRLGELLEAPITVRSRVGRGSVFTVEVPIVPAASFLPRGQERPGSQQNGAPWPRPYQAHSILILEDDTELGEALKLLLESRGYRTLAARDTGQALAIAGHRDTCAGLIITDYNLAGANGIETVGKIWEASGRKIPAIFLTGDIPAETLREIAEKDQVHLYKPVDVRRLMELVNSIVRAGSREAGPPPTVFVVDDDREVREAMRDLLEGHCYCCEVFADAPSFLQAYSRERQGCLIADARLPGMGGLQLIEHLAGMESPLPVIMITAYGDVATAVTAMKAGAADFLQKPVRHTQLLDCVARALRSNRRPGAANQTMTSAKLEGLSPRQREILDLVLGGKPSKIIASELRLSQRTVDNHRAAIMRKAGVNSLSALIRVALAAG